LRTSRTIFTINEINIDYMEQFN